MRQYLLFLILLLGSMPTFGGDEPCCTKPLPKTDVQKLESSVAKILDKAAATPATTQGPSIGVFDGIYLFDLKKTSFGLELRSTSIETIKGKLSSKEKAFIRKMSQLTFENAIVELKKKKAKLSITAKLTLLSILGDKAPKGAEGTLCEAIALLGFENCSGGAIAHFKYPLTGEYYIQKGGIILNTKKKDLEQTMSRLAESKVFRRYNPRSSEWAARAIDLSGTTKIEDGDKNSVILLLNPEEEAIGAKIVRNVKTDDLKALYMHSILSSDKKTQTVDLIAVANTPPEPTLDPKRALLKSPLLEEMRQMVTAQIENNEGTTRLDRSFKNDLIVGTTKIEKDVLTPTKLDPINPNLSINVIDLKDVSAKVGAGRTPHSEMGGPESVLFNSRKTRYDKLDVLVDSRLGTNTVYLSSMSRLYAIDGIDNLTAFGIQNQLKTTIPSEQLGDFSIVYDIGSLLGVKQKNPTDSSTPSFAQKISLFWQRMIGKNTSIGTEMGYTVRPATETIATPVSGSGGNNMDSAPANMFYSSGKQEDFRGIAFITFTW